MGGLVSLCIGAPALSLAATGCAYNPQIERSQFFLVSDVQLGALSEEAWTQARQEMPVSVDTDARARVHQVAERVLRAAGEDPGLWQTELFEAPEINAFALPGRKIGLHSGLVAFATSDDELASVIGHEIAHVKLRHGAERVSQDLAARGLIGLATGEDADAARVFGIATTLGLILPYSRTHELEADRLGLQYMANAGYDPFAAVSLWERIASQSRQPDVLAFLSTHPSGSMRVKSLRAEAVRLTGRD